jgi:hypothetical protein
MKHAHVSCTAALLVGLAVVACSGTAAAEREVGLGVAYDARAPIGSFHRTIPEISYGGLQARWDFYPLDALATGIQVQYNLFQRPSTTDTLTTADGAITGTTFRYASFWAAIPTVRYYLFPRSAFRPYAELGIGGVGVTTVVLLSDQSQRDVTTALIVQPSVGVLWRIWEPSPPETSPEDEAVMAAAGKMRKPMESMFGLTASATYAYTTADVAGSSNVSYAGLQIGIYAKP